MNVFWTRFAFTLALMGGVAGVLYAFANHVVALAVFSAMLLALLLYYV